MGFSLSADSNLLCGTLCKRPKLSFHCAIYELDIIIIRMLLNVVRIKWNNRCNAFAQGSTRGSARRKLEVDILQGIEVTSQGCFLSAPALAVALGPQTH